MSTVGLMATRLIYWGIGKNEMVWDSDKTFSICHASDTSRSPTEI